MSRGSVAAVDLGATSGRVILGHVGHNELRLTQVARFPNGPVTTPDGLHWDLSGLWVSIRAGLREAAKGEPALASIGVDSWAVDYARMAGGRMLAEPFHYRDSRTAAGADAVERIVPRAELYAQNGLQFLPFNTLYQLAEDRASGKLVGVERVLLVPDLIDNLLTGSAFAERTNASTTGLIDVTTGEWNEDLIQRLGVPRGILPQLVAAGTTLGPVTAELRAELGLPDSLQVITVGSHDTASAVVAVPASDPDFAYISCGTWGLVGVELETPLISEAGRAANFTNEGGVDGRIRYLHNVMGLWLLSETVRTWEAESRETVDLVALLAAAASVTTPVTIFDVNDESFLAPGDMPARIAEWCARHSFAMPKGRAEVVRSIIESLATAFAAAVRTASELSGKRVAVIHIVGGGSQNTLLCQLTADRAGLPVVAGPVEATAIGNVLIQARALGLVDGDLETLRALVTSTTVPERYVPRTR